MFWFIVVGPVIGGCLFRLAEYYFTRLQKKRYSSRLAAQKRCTQAYSPRSYAVSVHRIPLPASLYNDLYEQEYVPTEQEKNHMAFYRYLVECGKLNEEV